MTDYKKYINALRKCAKEHENDIISTGHIIISDLCRDTANLLESLEQESCKNIKQEGVKEIFKAILDAKSKFDACGIKSDIYDLKVNEKFFDGLEMAIKILDQEPKAESKDTISKVAATQIKVELKSKVFSEDWVDNVVYIDDCLEIIDKHTVESEE